MPEIRTEIIKINGEFADTHSRASICISNDMEDRPRPE